MKPFQQVSGEPVRSVRWLTCIEVSSFTGFGVDGDPARVVFTYWIQNEEDGSWFCIGNDDQYPKR